MSCDIDRARLTDAQKGQICGVLSIGCDRQTAANIVGCLAGDIGRLMKHDFVFAESILRAEATAELNHMRAVHQAAKDEKNWRASVWWLERRLPERFGPRGAGAVTIRQLKAFIAILVDSVSQEIHNQDDRDRLLARMRALADSVEQLLRDQSPSENESPFGLIVPPQDEGDSDSGGPPIDEISERGGCS